ncbi:MAG: GAF domain-containing protein [Desulfobacteraceae bacterium]
MGKINAEVSKKELIKEIHDLKEKSIIKDELVDLICQAIHEASIREKELHAIMNGSKAVLEQKGFTESARAIFDHCKDLIGATSGYVALLNETGEENEVLFLEAGGLPCDVNPELPMPIRGLRAEAYHSNKTVYHNDFMNSEWVNFMPKGHVILKNVLFAPLIIEGKTVGIIGLANKAADFNDNDAKMATGFGELAAIALQNSRNLDQRIIAEQQREKVIKDLEKALLEVKRLSGLLPICSYCKKVRNDKGYWTQIESYIHDHSEAEFTHSICKECAKKYYPDMAIYGEDES